VSDSPRRRLLIAGVPDHWNVDQGVVAVEVVIKG
jgi:hypothetical protein